MSINNIVAGGRVMWIEFKSEEYDSLSVLFSANSAEKKKPDEKYPPSNTFSVRISGAYAKALRKYADYTGPMYITAVGKLGTPRTQSRNGVMEVAPIPIMYADISIVPMASLDDAPPEATATSKTKKKKTSEEAEDAATADMFD